MVTEDGVKGEKEKGVRIYRRRRKRSKAELIIRSKAQMNS